MAALTDEETSVLTAIANAGMYVVPTDPDTKLVCRSLVTRKLLRPQPMLSREPDRIVVAYKATADGQEEINGRSNVNVNEV